MATTSTRQRILEACQARLQAVQTPEWVAPFADLLVLLGEVTDLGPDDPAAIAIVPGEDVTRRQGLKFLITLPIELQALVRADLDEPHAKGEELLARIKRAFELEDLTLGGLITRDSIQRLSTRVLPREPGLMTVGVGVTYAVDYQETWGAP